jgi:hypothetical protein
MVKQLDKHKQLLNKMKSSLRFIFLAIISVVLIATSCKKPADHSIRVKNDSSLPIGTITVGSLTFKDIKAKAASEYQAIPEGKYSISGDMETNEFSISGTGTHKWSIKITDGSRANAPREINVVED